MRALLVLALVGSALSAVPADRIDPMTLPGWKKPLPFDMYSGHLKIDIPSGPATGKYMVHYEFSESLNKKPTDPVVLWQNGGPGASSITDGMLGEMGYLQISEDSLKNETGGVPNLEVDPYSWNRLANMIYFDHPPGVEFSYCVDDNGAAIPCPEWNDQSAAQMLYESLRGFFKSFSEFSTRDFYMLGESYAGIYIPSTVTYYDEQVTNGDNPGFKLKAFAVGNGCVNIPGANPEWSGICNGYKQTQYAIDQYFNWAFYSKETNDLIKSVCTFPIIASTISKECDAALHQAYNEVGQVNPYMVFDNCGGNNVPWPLINIGKLNHTAEESMKYWDMVYPKGGIRYKCIGKSTAKWLGNDLVQQALHINGTHGLSAFSYRSMTFSSYDAYPALIKKYRIMIYNGDMDSVCPYWQNLDWIDDIVVGNMKLPQMKQMGHWNLPKTTAVSGINAVWKVPGSGHTFTFTTLRGAGHMAPHFQPERAFYMYEKFLNNKPL